MKRAIRPYTRPARQPFRRRSLHAYLADRTGAIAVLAAVMFPVVIGGIGLGVETSFWYMSERKLQHAADLAAHAASARLRAGDDSTKIRIVATNIAANSGFMVGQGTITVSHPPTSGTYAGDSNSVEVVLSEDWPRWFTALFGVGPINLDARAVSRIQGGANACVLALSSSASGAVTVSGSTTVALEGCDIASNSVSSTSFAMSGSATVSTGCVYTVGQSSVTAGLQLTTCQSVRENAPVARDPYRNVPEPAVVGSCNDGKVGNPTLATTLTPTHDHPSGMKSMRFCSGLDLKGQVNFAPGLYIIEGGDLTINGGDPNSASTAQMFGEGVTFYIRGTRKLVLNGKVSLDLAAPTSGAFSGILFFGARDAVGVTHKINGTSGSTLQGAIYAPGSAIEFAGNSEVANGCTQVIGATVTITGNSTLRSDCAAAGTQPIVANEGLTIVD